MRPTAPESPPQVRSQTTAPSAGGGWAVSLRWLIIVPFVIQLVLVVGAIAYLALRSNRTVATENTKQLLQMSSQQANLQLTNLFRTYNTVAQLQTNDFLTGQWPQEDWRAIEQYLWRRLREFPDLGQLVYSDPQGNLRGVSRLGGWRRFANGQSHNQSVWQWSVSDRGHPAGRPRLYWTSEPQSQAWFNAAVGVGQPTWSSLDQRQQNRNWQWSADWVMHYAWPLYDDRSGRLLGVFSANLNLMAVGQLLRSIPLPPQGQVFVFTDEGTVVATSSDQLPYRVEQRGELNQLHPLSLQSFPDRAIQSAGYYLLDRFGGFRYLPDRSSQLYQFHGKRYLLHLKRCNHPTTPDWWIAVLVPESAFLSDVQETAEIMLLLAGTALLLAMGIGWWTVQQVLRPLEQLNQATRAAARIQFQPVDSNTGVQEFDALAQTFNAMAATLRLSFSALQDSKSHLTQVLESLPMGVLVLSQDGSLQYVNSVAGGLLQLPIGLQPLGRTCETLHHRLFLAGSEAPFPIQQLPGILALEGKTVAPTRLDVQQTHGRRLPLEVLAVPLFDSEQAVTGAIVVLQDITDRKVTEELLVSYNQNLERQVSERTAALAVANHHLAAARDAAEQANRAKTVFLANVTHELRTPLHAILGFGQLLRSRVLGLISAPMDPALEHLDAIARNGSYLLQLIDDLLSIARVETDHLELEPIDFDLLALLNDLHEIFEMRSRSARVHFQMAVAGTIPHWVKGDGRRLRQILTNLLDNAFKFVGMPGQVTLSVDLGEGDLLVFEISNTGEGIHPEEMPDIFEPFVQAKAGRRLRQGTGLGLAIGQRLALLMGGSLVAESRPGILTIFRLQVPLPRLDGLLAHPEPPARKPLALLESAPPEPWIGRLLIVDPLRDRGQAYVNYLKQVGLESQCVHHGWDALRQWTSWQPRLLWVDLRLPDGEGLATVRRIRAIERKNLVHRPCAIVAIAPSPQDHHCLQELDCTLLPNSPPLCPLLLDLIRGLLAPQGPICPIAVPVAPHSVPDGQPSLNLRDRFAELPIEWRLALDLAARSADEDQVRTLLTELPPDYHDLCQAIEDLLENFQLEQIADLAQPPTFAP